MIRCMVPAVAAAIAVLALAGCGSEDSAPQVATATSTAVVATPDDERQIRELIAAQNDAIAEGDWDTLADLTCSKFREQARDPGANLVPPISQFGPREQIVALDPDVVADQLSQQFGSNASPETINQVARAIVGYDEPVYRDGMLELLTQSMTLTVDSVDNVDVDGDSATADVTTTRVMGESPPQTSTDNTPYVREDGQWLDCADPSGQS